MDYAESLASWYLRLNGFFPITNFVLHQPKGKGQSTDCDILAVRPPFACETISNDVDVLPCDTEFFEGFGVKLGGNTVGVIAQVKSGYYDLKKLRASFCDEHVFYCIHRLGIVQGEQVEGLVKVLRTRAIAQTEDKVICKLIVDTSRHRLKAPKFQGHPEWLSITLEEVEKFIIGRFGSYWQHKSGSRMFFSDPLVQYFAWKVGLKFED